MNSLKRKLVLLGYESYDIEKDDFYCMILKIEEEKIRLYKPKEREKLNYTKEKNYIEHILKYLKKLNINITNINKTNINEIEIKKYILNNLTTLALLDEYKDLTCFDDDTENDEYKNIQSNDEQAKYIEGNISDQTITNFFELNYMNICEKEEFEKNKDKLIILIDTINDIFKKHDIPLLKKDEIIKNNEIYNVISALHLLKEKLKTKEKIQNENYENLFNFNINVNNKEMADFVYILRYIFNEKLRDRKTHIKNILNETQILTYNPIIDIKQGKVGR
ncbi:hypothetical protein YYC_04668 [Plasmodium yoelii 17X]|uniref:RNA transcription n=3 Tax=Plasmodium yoelii TaxID=5861 RepID=A0AAF0B464_PLAYO|nr:RNA transcription, translation and transport factor protein, putative [Plasmodium yoelii]ETB57871.1 hypothetical protein YYC_04668 [Plasmodium yoelii 17X]WBY57511.1 RNA transcription [Plasmodium yoelii yoelii]CDU18143.1 conserved Plasmodium protein, unknown function [Plasmodium yoelii]VTZ78560.1 RNA transcription, translation and transport factor protein, putative [Plasmodium yoelii]|eukprot:XP_022812254.1 RNA transcription, translation and transport factor protein, putative [Plasmodium yoelii]